MAVHLVRVLPEVVNVIIDFLIPDRDCDYYLRCDFQGWYIGHLRPTTHDLHSAARQRSLAPGRPECDIQSFQTLVANGVSIRE
jgi:hypothetical protein